MHEANVKILPQNLPETEMETYLQINTLIALSVTIHSAQDTRVVPKVMSNFFLQANWEQQTKESMVVDGTSCCVILECLLTSIACIT